MSVLNELPYHKCVELLSGGVVGRVGITIDGVPRIVPVNYAVIDEAIVFRTAPYTMLGAEAWRSNLAFEVDHIDYERHKGWSVLATGAGEMVDDEQELATIRTFWDPQPWADGSRLLYVLAFLLCNVDQLQASSVVLWPEAHGTVPARVVPGYANGDVAEEKVHRFLFVNRCLFNRCRDCISVASP